MFEDQLEIYPETKHKISYPDLPAFRSIQWEGPLSKSFVGVHPFILLRTKSNKPYKDFLKIHFKNITYSVEAANTNIDD